MISRRRMVKAILTCVAAILAGTPRAFSQQPAAPADDAGVRALQAELERIAAHVGGTVGVGVRHLESGRELFLNRAVKFPMGSVFKLPLAVQLLTLADQQAVDLEKTLEVQAGDLRPGSGKLVKTFRGPRAVSLRELLETMMIDSDNTATDILWREAGGAPAIMARMGALGISGISVDRPTGPLLAAAMGFGELASGADMTPAGFEALALRFPRGKRKQGFLNDERDTTTPEAIVALLQKLWRQEALSARHTAMLISIMRRCETGKQRLRGGLPAWTTLAHKTGTLRPFVFNDVGVISLPGSGHVIVAALIKASAQEQAVQERAIAAIARAVYEHAGVLRERG